MTQAFYLRDAFPSVTAAQPRRKRVWEPCGNLKVRPAAGRRPNRRMSVSGAARPPVRSPHRDRSPKCPSAAGPDGGRCGRTTPPPILMKWSTVTPLVGASGRARWRASEPSWKDTYGRERLHQRRVGGGTPRGTPGATHPTWPCRASGKKGGVAPVLSLSAGAVRGRRLMTKNPHSDGGNWKGCVLHPLLCFWYTPPSVCVPFCSTPTVTPIVTPERSSGQLVRQLLGCR